MNRILIDDDLRKRLGDLTQPVELCDASGRVVARVLPIGTGGERERLPPEPTSEELDRISKSNEPRYSTDELLRHLESL